MKSYMKQFIPKHNLLFLTGKYIPTLDILNKVGKKIYIFRKNVGKFKQKL